MSDTPSAKSVRKRGIFQNISQWFKRTRGLRPTPSENQFLVQDKETFHNDHQNNISPGTMPKYGSDAHSKTEFARSKSHLDEGITARKRAGYSEEIGPADVECLHSKHLFSINNDGKSARPRSHSHSEHPNFYYRKLSDPLGTARCLDLRRDFSPGWDRADESDLEKSLTRQNEHAKHWGRNQLHISSRPKSSGSGETFYLIDATDDNDYNIVEKADNEVEARRMINNHMFGFRMWMSQVSHVSRQDQESELYNSEETSLTASAEATLRFSTILYSVFFGWWLTLLYDIVGCLMYITYIGREHGKLCFQLGKFFLYPFGKSVHRCTSSNRSQQHPRMFGLRTISGTSETLSDNVECTAIDLPPSATLSEVVVQPSTSAASNATTISDVAAASAKPTTDGKAPTESQPLQSTRNLKHWKKPGMYVWLLLGAPVLLAAHVMVFCLSWFPVVSIPIARMNGHAITKVLFANPEDTLVNYSGRGDKSVKKGDSEVVLILHQCFNVNYFKLKVDGVNVILVNLLFFVVITILLGFIDEDHTVVSPIAKCVMGMCAILPVTYYIGMAIACISAQSTFAVGAIMNATFGSIVEVILYIIMLKEGVHKDETCYMELVKSTMTGSILCCILLTPGISMIVGGIKYRRQSFNHRSANISSSLLFVALIGVFAPTIFSKIYGNLTCDVCQVWQNLNSTFSNETGFICSGCKTVTTAPYDDNTLFKGHVMPLMYSCALVLFLTYFIGLFFSMKTHSKEIFEEFEQLQKADGAVAHTSAQWSNIKSTCILFASVLAISLCSDLIADNIAPLLNLGIMSEYFVGVSLLSIVGVLPELVNGVLFALQNNVNLGIEIGSAAAIQVGMVQLPIIIIADLIYPLGFGAVFNDIHLYAVIIAVIIITYVFMDGKSDYFQGSIVVAIYALLMAMYFFVVTPETAVCKSE